MKNPWVKKNPFLSMWLSGANRAVGAARGQIAGSIKREARKTSSGIAAGWTEQVLDFWGRASAGPAPRKRRTRRR